VENQDLSIERRKIDAIDEQILQLLQERVGCALRVGEKKKAMGVPLFDPARESRIYDRLRERNDALSQGGSTPTLPDAAITAIFREIISACRNAEHPVRVAFLGPAGTNTQEAATAYFGSAFSPLPLGTPDEVCHAVAAGGADYGVLAIENSTHGIVSPTLDLLADSPLTVCAEIKWTIHACLLSNTELGKITTVYSHEQALAQCRGWLASHLPGASLVPVTSTARGAEMAKSQDGAAAVGAAIAANIYGLQIVARNIEDLTGNSTRFFVVGPCSGAGSTPKATGRDKTSLTFLVPHKSGALVSVLEIFRKHGVNLSMIQSRPSRQQTWEYRFFADVQAHQNDESLQAALAELNQHTVSYKILGSYPEAD
jgi:chorismate mutase/prephenate dehydratase